MHAIFITKTQKLIYAIIFVHICLYLFLERRPSPDISNSEVSFENMASCVMKLVIKTPLSGFYLI